MTVREYTIDYRDPEEAARVTVQMYKDGLIGFRGKTPHPEELEWEIAVYDYILEDPAARLKQYQDARYPEDYFEKPYKAPLSKREAVKKLGWQITGGTAKGGSDGNS